MFIADIAAGVVSMRFNARGPNYATVSACATSAHAIGDAFRTIQYGDADIIISGGAEATVTPMAIGGFANMTALSERNDDPADGLAAVRSQSRRLRHGRGLGHRDPRGARARTRARRDASTAKSWATARRATPTTSPASSPSTRDCSAPCAARSPTRGCTPDEVDYVNAHGTSTPLNDSNEAMAIAKVFGDAAAKLSVSSTKSMTGHMLGAAGSVEFIASLLAIRDQIVPPTINHCTPDPACGDLDFTPNKAKPREVRAALSNSAGFGGHNVSLVVKRYQE